MRTLSMLALLSLGLSACGDKGDTGGGALDDTATGGGEEGGGEEGGDDGPAPTGAELYQKWCSVCHGAEGGGTASGPGLERELKQTDQQLVDIILNGKEDMDPVPVTEAEAQLIVDYLRELFPDA